MRRRWKMAFVYTNTSIHIAKLTQYVSTLLCYKPSRHSIMIAGKFLVRTCLFTPHIMISRFPLRFILQLWGTFSEICLKSCSYLPGATHWRAQPCVLHSLGTRAKASALDCSCGRQVCSYINRFPFVYLGCLVQW